MWRKLTAAIILIVLAQPAVAYIGPGVGAGMIATVIGILTAIALSVFAVVWYPIKRLLRRGPRKGKTTASGRHN
ncbi:MAG: hypothetical protein R3D05_05280 [Dongiaceae bacterium]